MKKVLLLVIDALAARTVLPALQDGALPHFQQLVDAGAVLPRCTSVFPSITPTATASIITGGYPRQHGIAGNFWYDSEDGRVAYFGDDFWVIVNKGLGNFFHEYMVELNYRRLRSDTLFKTLQESGASTACINYMWFSANQPHEVNIPLLFKLLPGVSFPETIEGPDHLFLGDFVSTRILPAESKAVAPGGFKSRYGFHDAATAKYLHQLAESGPMPDFTLAYFPDNDFESHRRGAAGALSVLQEIDTHLGRLFEVWGGCEAMLEEVAVLVVGDHAQSDLVESEDDRVIDLDELFSDFQLVPAGSPWRSTDELMICPNMRAMQIYLQHWAESQRDHVVERLLSEPRVDQVIWDNLTPGNRNSRQQARWFIATEDRGSLEFWAGSDGEKTVTDEYGNCWCWQGQLETVDARLGDSRRLKYGQYPNALERIACGLSSVGGDIWATARIGCEFKATVTEVHRKGSHGSLHEDDSTSPLIFAGTPFNVEGTTPLRSVDITPLCLAILDRSFRHPLGAGRMITPNRTGPRWSERPEIS